MNDREQGDQSDADWLAAQFGATGGVPTPKKPEPEKPVDPAAPADPPTLVNPFGAPGAMPPPAGPGAAFPPPPGAGQPPPAAPAAFPGFPPAGPPPAAQPPVQPPAMPPPAMQSPPAQPPTTPPPGAEPTPPPAPAATPFPWELAPGGDPANPPPVAPIPPVAAPVAAPAAPPPAPAAPAPAVPAAFAWETPTGAAPTPHEPAPLDPAFDGGPQFAAEPPPAPMPWETARLPEVAPESADAPAFWEPAPTQAIDQIGWDGPPTQAMDQSAWEPEPTQLILPPVESFGAAAAATELLGASPDPANSPTSALDALFGESRFREYEAGADESENPFNRKPKDEAGSTKSGGVGTAQKVLLWVAGGLVGIIALVALFLVGTRLPDLLGPAPIVTKSASPSPSPSPTVLPVGPVAPGTYAWDELLGGECLDPFESPWDEEFTVVDCAVPHPAQMVFRGEFVPADPTNEAYPGEAALQSQLALLCSAPGVIDLAAAGAYADAQFQASFPATEEQWDDGDRAYFCFVSRSSGEPLTGSVAVPPPPPADPAAPAAP